MSLGNILDGAIRMMPPRPRGMLCCPPRLLAHPLARDLQEETDTMLRDCPNGGYRFLPGISAFSSGTVAMPGHEIVHVTLGAPLPWREGFARIAEGLGFESLWCAE